MKNIKLFIFFIIFELITSNVNAKILEMIAAKVNGEIITLSELENELGPIYEQVKRLNSPEEQEEVLKVEKNKMLNILIENKLILQNAEKSGLKASPEEVNHYLEEAIANVKKNFPDNQTFENELKARNTTLTEFRQAYRNKIKEELIIQKYIQQEVKSKIDVTDEEIDNYFEQQKEEVKARHILTKTEEEASAILAELKNGKDFIELAKEKSLGPSAAKGGELGYFRRGDMVPEFEEKVFQMQKGEISEPVKTKFGYHIIKLEDRRTVEPGEKVHAYHIVLKTPEEAEEILKKLKDGENFEKLAKERSLGPSKEKGGDLGYFQRGDMVSEFEDVVFKLKIGELSDVVKTDYGYHIIKVVDKKTLDSSEIMDMKSKIKNTLWQNKMEKLYYSWIEKLKSEAKIEVKLSD